MAMELGYDGILMNTAVAAAEDAEKMALAMKLAVQAGRLAFEAGRMEKKLYASASSPMAGVVGQKLTSRDGNWSGTFWGLGSGGGAQTRTADLRIMRPSL